jgi:PAS domain S-box-containing protein
MKKTHERLKKQVREHLGSAAKLPKKWRAFLQAVDDCYHRNDEDRAIVEMSLEAASQELFRRNEQLTNDIRERTEAQQALKENEARFRALADSAPVLIWMSGPHGPCTYFNKTWLDFTGRPLESEVGDGWKEGVHPEDKDVLDETFRQAFRAQEKFSIESRLRRADGEYRWLWTTGVPRRTPDGSFAGFVGTSIDVTERRRQESELQSSENRLRRQNQALMDLAGRKSLQRGEDLEAALKEITIAAARTLDVERASVWFFEGNSDRMRCVDLYERSKDRHSSGATLSGATFPAYFRALRDERTIPAHDARTDPRTRELAETYLKPLGIASMLDAPIRLDGQLVGVLCHEHIGMPRTWMPDEQQFSGSLADLVALVMEAHERRWAEDALLKSEERFQLVAKATNDAVWDWDLATDILWCNEAVRTLFGYTSSEIGGTGTWWKSLIHPDDRLRVMNGIEAALSGRRDLWSGEYRLKRADNTYAFVLDRGTVLRDPQGKAVRLIRATTDLTDRKGMEARMLQSEKLSAMGHLAAGVAHEINNPLGVILGFAQAVLRRLPDGESPFEKPLKSIEREALRCKALVQDLLTFSRASDAEQEMMGLNDCVDGALSLVLAQSKMSKVEMHRALADSLPPILGNRNQIQQVIINLANNAIDAMPKGGALTVKTELLVDLASAWVCLKVSDTGTGIPPEILSRIFEPFFTTKPVGSGTGLGLSLVYEIVKKHGGQVEVESKPGLTEFCVRFPTRGGRMSLNRLPPAMDGLKV